MFDLLFDNLSVHAVTALVLENLPKKFDSIFFLRSSIDFFLSTPEDNSLEIQFNTLKFQLSHSFSYKSFNTFPYSQEPSAFNHDRNPSRDSLLCFDQHLILGCHVARRND